MPAPKVMMPAGAAVPKWGHRHGGILRRLPTSHICPAPFHPSPVGGQATPLYTCGGFPPQKMNKFVPAELPTGMLTQPLWHPPTTSPFKNLKEGMRTNSVEGGSRAADLSPLECQCMSVPVPVKDWHCHWPVSAPFQVSMHVHWVCKHRPCLLAPNYKLQHVMWCVPKATTMATWGGHACALCRLF